VKSALGATLFLVAASLACTGRAAADWDIATDIAGRWVVDTPGHRRCELGFSGGPNVPHGVITAVGFCPPIFLDHPRWWAEPGGIAIGHRRNRPLALLGPGWYHHLEGHSATGEWLSLSH
jgi:hypothetical protein